MAVSATAAAAQDLSARRRSYAELEHYWSLEDRAKTLEPRRRDTPMRAMNITDEEVREVQAAALDVVPRSIINIGTVTTGCPCEDGPGCSDQVWIVATNSSRTTGLLLSRIRGTWVVGPVQAWWLRFNEFWGRQGGYRSWNTLDATYRKLLDDMPFCASNTDERPSDASATRSAKQPASNVRMQRSGWDKVPFEATAAGR